MIYHDNNNILHYTITFKKVMLALQELVRIRSRPIIVSWYEFHVSSNKLQASRQSAKSIRHGYYQVLGISPTSRQSDIKRAYLEIVKKHHPDRAGSDNEESKAIFAVSISVSQYFCISEYLGSISVSRSLSISILSIPHLPGSF